MTIFIAMCLLLLSLTVVLRSGKMVAMDFDRVFASHETVFLSLQPCGVYITHRYAPWLNSAPCANNAPGSVAVLAGGFR